MVDQISLHNVYAEERRDLPFKQFTFSGGEPHVEVDPKLVHDQYVWIDARLGSPEGWMRLLALLDAVSACQPRRLGLFLPYFPGARQDRRQPGTPLTVSIYADILREFSAIELVCTVDPHSDVVASCMNGVPMEILPLEEVMPADLTTDFDGWICPDAGAEKRVHSAARFLGVSTVVHARKQRNVATGQLSGFSCEPLPKADGSYLIVDDICDGGGTFQGLAKEIWKNTPGAQISLWCAHGIFSKGFQPFHEFLGVHTTDSFPQAQNLPGFVAVNKIHDVAAGVMRRRIAR